MKKMLKWLGVALLIPVALFLVVSLLLCLPPVQTWVAQRVAGYVSAQTGMDISVGRVALGLPPSLRIDDFRMMKATKDKPPHTDTIADVGQLDVHVRFWPLLKKQVQIDDLNLSDTKLNTLDLIASARIKGHLEHLHLESHGLDWGEESLRIDNAVLQGAQVNVELSDTVSEDTTETVNKWRIFADQIKVRQSRVTVHMPGDSLSVYANLGQLAAHNGYFDLGKGEYKVGQINWTDGRLTYDRRFEKPVSGLDFNHIALSDLTLRADSLVYGESGLSLSLRQLAFHEKSGLQVDSLSVPVSLDSNRVYLKDFYLKTPDSQLAADFEMDFNTFASGSPGQGKLAARIDGYFGKQDLVRFMGEMPKGFVKRMPNSPLSLSGFVRGNLQSLSFSGLNIEWPTAIKMQATGTLENVTDFDHLKADLQLKSQTADLGFMTELLPPAFNRQVRIPRNIGIDGRFRAAGHQYSADFKATESGGTLNVNASLDADMMRYDAKLEAKDLQLAHFVPGMGLGAFSGYVEAGGQGTDLLSPQTRLDAEARITRFSYDKWHFDGMNAKAHVADGRVKADVDSHNPLFDGKITLQALTGAKRMQATLSGDVHYIDLYQLHLADDPLSLRACAHVDVMSDLKENHQVQGYASDLMISYKGNTYRPDQLYLDLLARRDTTHAVVEGGDFNLRMDAATGYERLFSQVSRLSEELSRQILDKKFDQVELRRHLPDASIYLSSGNNNFIVQMLQREGYLFKEAEVDLRSSPVAGLDGRVTIDSLVAQGVQIDTLRLFVESDSTQFFYNGQVRNRKDHPQYAFNALFNGSLFERGSRIQAKLYDADDRLGLDIGLSAALLKNGVGFHLTDKTPILGYKEFEANDSNYVFLGDDKRVRANLRLLSSDGTGLQLYSTNNNPDALQDLTMSLSHFKLKEITSVLPYLPQISGTANGDFHLVKTENHLSVSSSLMVDDLIYEQTRMGNIGSEFVYIPREDGGHYVDGILSQNDREVGTVVGTYHSEGDGYLDATVGLERLPLSLVNGFIPNQLFALNGYAEGEVAVKGPLARPQVDGEVYLDSSYVSSVPYGVKLRFADDPVRIVGSHLLFENFEIFAYNDSPLNMAGWLDFSDPSKMSLDLRMRATNYQLINAKENLRSEAYGKAFVNFFGRMQGPVEALQMRGKLDVLGTTDMTYVLRDSPLTTDNRLDELVHFTSFNDTTETVISRPSLGGFNMDLSISIDEGAHIKCDLNSDHSNYVDLIGGGDLRMQYNSADDLRLTGRYTLANGEMKYSLPVIPLKTFTIQDGSYIEFMGDAMNPMLNITATERTKANVSTDGTSGRPVDFDCGVVITKTLQDMGLEFTIDAPEDLTLRSELATMSKEERGKLAVTMLTTGLYLADGNTSSITMNSALSSFLQSEINNITGSALRTLDLSVGLDNATDASGAMHTDYSFKFAKRFWNNRLRIVVGGKVSTGSDAAAQNESFFDNVAFEYRLSPTSNQYLKLFYNRNAYDWIEGYVGEYGGGFVWRRKLEHFKDIFRLKADNRQLPAAPRQDSIRVVFPQPPAALDTTRTN